MEQVWSKMICREVFCLFIALFSVRYHLSHANEEAKAFSAGAQWLSSLVFQTLSVIEPTALNGNMRIGYGQKPKDVLHDIIRASALRNISFVSQLNDNSVLSIDCTQAMDDLVSDIFKLNFSKIEISKLHAS